MLVTHAEHLLLTNSIDVARAARGLAAGMVLGVPFGSGYVMSARPERAIVRRVQHAQRAPGRRAWWRARHG
jgi:hypothetical protein